MHKFYFYGYVIAILLIANAFSIEFKKKTRKKARIMLGGITKKEI